MANSVPFILQHSEPRYGGSIPSSPTISKESTLGSSQVVRQRILFTLRQINIIAKLYWSQRVPFSNRRHWVYRILLFDHKLSLTHRVPFISADNREVVGSSPTRHAERGDSSVGESAYIQLLFVNKISLRLLSKKSSFYEIGYYWFESNWSRNLGFIIITLRL